MLKKYKVWYTAYDNNEWRHYNDFIIVDAENEEDAKKIVNDKSNFCEEYFAKEVILLND